MMFAKRLSDLFPKKRGLKLYLHETMSGQKDSPHDYETIHASDLVGDPKFCPREFALLKFLSYKRKERFIPTAMRYTFDLGSAMAELACNRWARDIAVGNWECLRCQHVTKMSRYPGRCPKCSGHHLRYQELRFVSHEFGVSGGIDLFVQLPGEKLLRLVELKSIGIDVFKSMASPLVEHRIRTSLYLTLVESARSTFSDLVNVDEGIILYMAKGYGVKDPTIKEAGISDHEFSPFKDFYVRRDDSEVGDLLLEAKKVAEFIGGGGMPEGICATGVCQRAKQCSVMKVCFSGEYPPGWEKPNAK